MAEKKTEKRVARMKRPLPSWEQRFKELERFKKGHGHCNVPKWYPSNPPLGWWVRNVRKAKKHGTIAEERVRRLDALGFRWVLRPSITVVWEQRINDLKAFKKQHGHCNVPHKYPPNPALGKWVSQTRHRKKGGKLDKGQVRCLNALGFCWERKPPIAAIWKQHIHDLTVFKKEHDHCNVPFRYPLKPGLGRWVLGVRHRKKRGVLAEDKILLLDALGFSWARKLPGIKVPWEERINDLRAFKKKHGHCNVPGGYQANPALGRWVFNLRQRKKRGELTEDQILSLDALGFRWGSLEMPKLPKTR